MYNNKMFLTYQTSVLKWFLNDHDTEDWSNDAENSALQTVIIKF